MRAVVATAKGQEALAAKEVTMLKATLAGYEKRLAFNRSGTAGGTERTYNGFLCCMPVFCWTHLSILRLNNVQYSCCTVCSFCQTHFCLYCLAAKCSYVVCWTF